jgi:hypothetical protein
MHGLDELLVGSILLASSLYTLVYLGPRWFKRRLSATAAALLRLAPRIPGLQRLALRLEAAAAAPATGACGGCENCGPAPAPPGSAVGQAGGAEIRIPVSKIGRR